jgi:type II secretory pathway pseudopilin PulG
MRSNKGQTTVEMIVVVGMIMLIFILILLITYSKTVESNDFKMQLDAKRVAQSAADNINTIAEQGHGYYRFFTLPQYLFGGEDYNISTYGNFMEVDWISRSGPQAYTTQLITANVSDYCFEKSSGKVTKVFNYEERVIVTCERPDLMVVGDSFTPESLGGTQPLTVSIEVFNYGVRAADAFKTNFSLFAYPSGELIWSQVNASSGIPADRRITVRKTISGIPLMGSYNLTIHADSEDLLTESFKGDNWYNATITFT